MDRLDALKVFCSVVDAGGFSRAADRLGMSTSSVTNQVAALETHFGVKLLHRTTRSMSLTDEGRQCYENAARLLGDMSELEASLSHSSAAPSGLLRVELPASISHQIVAPALPRFLRDYPDIALRMSANDRLVDMVDEGIDVMVRISNLTDSRLVAQTLSTTSYVCCASPAYVARRGRPAAPADLNGHDCINFIFPKSRRIRPWHFQHNGQASAVTPPGVFATDHVDSLISAARAGCGIIQVLSLSVQDQLASGALVALLTDCSAPGPDVAVLFQQRHLRAAKVKVFAEFLHQTFQAWPGAGGARL